MNILHLTDRFLPEFLGGREIYISSLIRSLAIEGISSEVAIPAKNREDRSYKFEGLVVNRYVTNQSIGLQTNASALQLLLDERLPDLVHMHTIQAGVGLPEARVVKRSGIPLVVTIHTPPDFCKRGTMMRWGEEVCDGIVQPNRCAACSLQNRGVPRILASGLGGIPVPVAKLLHRCPGIVGKVLGRPEDIRKFRQESFGVLELADRVVAVCQWLLEALRANGVPNEKLSLSRQATAGAPKAFNPRRREPGEPLHVGFLGRYCHVKGIHNLILAVRRLPESVPIRLILHGSVDSNHPDKYLARLKKLVGIDRRIQLGSPLETDIISEFFSKIDVLAVPSIWLETGPLVVYESLAHHVPVLGSNLGGIAELVQPGRTGWLLPPNDISAWADRLNKLALNPEPFSFQPHAVLHRRWEDAAAEMATEYHRLADRKSCLERTSARDRLDTKQQGKWR